MDDTIALPLARLDEINLRLGRAGAVADLVSGYAAANEWALPNLAPGTLLNAMQIVRGELDAIREALKSAQGNPGKGVGEDES